MSDNEDKLFWPSYVDLLTSLFFVILVLFVVSFKLFTDERERINKELIEKKFKDEITNTLQKLMSDSTFFIYEPAFKRYRLAVNIQFQKNRYDIKPESVAQYETIKNSLLETGNKLKSIFEELKTKRDSAQNYNISYLLIISGRSSDLPGDNRVYNYELSYKRALSLYNFWNENIDFDFDNEGYRDLIDLQISGNGTGGIGRYFNADEAGNFSAENEAKNQCFLIQIIPKFGQLKKTI